MQYVKEFFNSALVEGGVIGGVSMFAATPALNLVISQSKGTSYPLSKPFTGAASFVSSGMAGYATVFGAKYSLGGNEKSASDWVQWGSSMAGGALSGVTMCPLEVIAQAQGDTNASMLKTARVIRRNFGLGVFFRGSLMMAARESAWATTYLAVVPKLSNYLQKLGYQEKQADAVALVVSSVTFGVCSTPVNLLRILMQSGLSDPARTYNKVINEVLERNPNLTTPRQALGFFAGGTGRAAASLTTGVFVYGASSAYEKMRTQLQAL